MPLCLPTKHLYTGVVPIVDKKMADLEKFEPSIPSEFKKFWADIFITTETSETRKEQVHGRQEE